MKCQCLPYAENFEIIKWIIQKIKASKIIAEATMWTRMLKFVQWYHKETAVSACNQFFDLLVKASQTGKVRFSCSKVSKNSFPLKFLFYSSLHSNIMFSCKNALLWIPLLRLCLPILFAFFIRLEFLVLFRVLYVHLKEDKSFSTSLTVSFQASSRILDFSQFYFCQSSWDSKVSFHATISFFHTQDMCCICTSSGKQISLSLSLSGYRNEHRLFFSNEIPLDVR